MYERDLAELRDKITGLSRSLHVTTGDMQVQETTIRALKGNINFSEFKSLLYMLTKNGLLLERWACKYMTCNETIT